MSCLPPIGNFSKNIPKEEKETIQQKQLSTEMLEKIFSECDKSGKYSDLTSRYWKPSTITQCKNEQSECIRNLLMFIIKNLDKDINPEEMKVLKSYLENNDVLKSVNLLDVKNGLDSVKILIAKELWKLDRDLLYQLDEYSKTKKLPMRFNELTKIANIFRRIESAKSEENLTRSGELLEDAISDLIDNGMLNDAIDTLNIFDECFEKSKLDIETKEFLQSSLLSALKNIFQGLISKEDPSRALQIAERMPGKMKDQHIFLVIAYYLNKKNDLDSANSLISKISEESPFKKAALIAIQRSH